MAGTTWRFRDFLDKSSELTWIKPSVCFVNEPSFFRKYGTTEIFLIYISMVLHSIFIPASIHFWKRHALQQDRSLPLVITHFPPLIHLYFWFLTERAWRTKNDLQELENAFFFKIKNSHAGYSTVVHRSLWRIANSTFSNREFRPLQSDRHISRNGTNDFKPLILIRYVSTQDLGLCDW